MAVQHYAIINGSGLVINVILWDGVSPYTPPAGDIFIQSDTAGIGWTYLGGVFSPPSLPPPPLATASYTASLRRQAAKLAAQGKTAQATSLYLKAAGVLT